jgi:hypothetical protein
MRLIYLTTLIAAASLSPCSVDACSRPQVDTAFDTVAPTATDIVAVQVESLALAPDRVVVGDGHAFSGKIRVLKHYRGSTPFEEIKYENSRCAGLRIDVGGVYLLATNSSGPTIELSTLEAPILHLSGFFTFDPALVMKYHRTVQQLEAALRGEGTFAITTPATRREMSTVTDSPPAPPPEDPAANSDASARRFLRDELLEMQRVDQKVRTSDAVTAREMRDTDVRNTTRLKDIIASNGWPTKSMVGADAASAAWLIAQHADHDPDFQLSVLASMKELLASGEARPNEYAYLYDRTHRPQRFGTQGGCAAAGKWEPRETENSRGVDQRRGSMQIYPAKLADYVEIMSKSCK